jgi:serine/threonine protein kinase
MQVAIKLLNGVHTDPEILAKVTTVSFLLKQQLMTIALISVIQRIKRETRVWYCISDNNVMPFLGVCHDLGPSIAMISPLYDNGDVQQYLEKNPKANLPPIVSLCCLGRE